MKIVSAKYIGSTHDFRKCPQTNEPEYALIGRSNVGKSSLVNAMVGRSLAMTSSQPGKTQSINHYQVNHEWYLADLPGYGYARVSKEQRTVFEKMVQDYLLYRPNLVCVFSLIDIRIEPQKSDVEFCRWLGENQIPFANVFTKADKISPEEIEKAISSFHDALEADWEEMPPFFVTSSLTSAGISDLLRYIGDVNNQIKNPKEEETK